MKILILGAAGFIGTNLTIELAKKTEDEITLVDRSKAFFKPIVSMDLKNVHILEADLTVDMDFDSILKDQEVVYHLVSTTVPTTSNQHISQELVSNVIFSANLFEACIRCGVKKVVFVSSGGTVYGKEVDCPLKEKTATNPISSYEAIADNYDGMYLGDDAVDQVVRQYGMERVGYILANTLHHKSYDGRFSHSNKEWAEQVSTPEHDADRMTFRTDWVVDSHPAVLDGFVTMFRKELEAQKEQEQPFVKQFYVVENLQAAPLKIERFGNLDDAMSQYQALPNHYMKALGVEKNPDPLPGSLDVLQCRNGIDTIVEDYKTVPGWDNPYIQNHVIQPLQGALAVQDVELSYELPDAYFHIQTCEDGFDYTLYNKDFTEQDGGILETDGDKSVQEAMTELLAEFGCDAAQGRVMDAAELREQADMVAEQQAEVLKEKLAAERPAPEETLSFYVAECLEFTFAGEFHDHLTMEEALEVYDKIPSERMNADKCIGFCIEEDGGFVGMYELVVNDKVQRENINSINYFRDDKLVQQAISDMEKLMAARQQSKEQERGSTKKSVLDALHSLKAKKQEQPAQEQDKPKKAKTKGMEL